MARSLIFAPSFFGRVENQIVHSVWSVNGNAELTQEVVGQYIVAEVIRIHRPAQLIGDPP